MQFAKINTDPCYAGVSGFSIQSYNKVSQSSFNPFSHMIFLQIENMKDCGCRRI